MVHRNPFDSLYEFKYHLLFVLGQSVHFCWVVIDVDVRAMIESTCSGSGNYPTENPPRASNPDRTRQAAKEHLGYANRLELKGLLRSMSIQEMRHLASAQDMLMFFSVPQASKPQSPSQTSHFVQEILACYELIDQLRTPPNARGKDGFS